MALFSFDAEDRDFVPVLSARPGPKDLDSRAICPSEQSFDVTEGARRENVSDVRTGTPPICIVSPAPKRQVVATKFEEAQRVDEKFDFTIAKSKAAKKKKKNQRRKQAAKPLPAAPAMTTIRGFHTPATSGAEDSDFSVASTPRLTPRFPADFPSAASSPALRPTSACGGISALRLQLDTLNLNTPTPKPRDASYASSGLASEVSSDSEKTETETYEVRLEHDFVSPDARTSPKPFFGGIDDTVRQNSMSRKMTAEDFEQISCLGKGAYGTVLLVKQKSTGRLFAQKQLRKASLMVRKKLVEQTKTERAILESVNRHPFVVKLYYAFQDHEKLYLILEYAQGGELFHHLAMERMFNEETAAFYMAEMVLALEHLHRNLGVIYRDLKPENCLLDAEGHLLLTDFGLSKVAVDENDTCKSMLGTIEYMAPEVIQGANYGMAVDWWSLGALGFDLLTGSPPFQANNHTKIQEKILKQKLQLPYFLSPDAKDLLTRLLRKDPRKRLGANMPKDLQTIKKHRFFRKIDWKKLQRRELEPPIQPLITDPELAENFASEFTALPLSPVLTRKGLAFDEQMAQVQGDPFGGFSFVAPASLLEEGGWGMMMDEE